MTARERKAPGSASAAAIAPAAAMAGNGPGRNGSETSSRVPLWEEWFQSATPAQQTEMLALASHQGLLYAHQVPPPANGAKSKKPIEDNSHLQSLSGLLQGKTEDLAGVACQPFTAVDS